MRNVSLASLLRHLSFTLAGGFFGAYAVLAWGSLASAQTMVLLESVIQGWSGNGKLAVWYLGAFFIYVTSTMLTVLLPHFLHANVRKLCPLIDAAAAVLLALFPKTVPVPVALYPIFFAMAFQWSTFSGVNGYVGSTIFSTNNTKQASLSLAEFLCHGGKEHLRRVHFYLCTLLCFHAGASVAYFAVSTWDTRASLCCLPLTLLSYAMVLAEDHMAQNVCMDAPASS